MKLKKFAMAFFLPSFFIVFTVSFSVNYSSVPLLSLWCNPSSPSNQTISIREINTIKTLLENLTNEAPKSHFSTLNATFRQELYTGIMQCRPALGPENCTSCAKIARTTILNLCQNSKVVSAWFDGCYVQISPISSSHNSHLNALYHSCSGRDNHQDLTRFIPALGALFLRLRANVISTHHGFSYQDIRFGLTNRHESKIFGLVECVRSLSRKECDSCIEKAVEKLLFYCGGKEGATLVHGLCFVRFDIKEFYHEGVNSSAGGGVTGGNFTFFTAGKVEGENGGRVKKLVLECWISGVACFSLFILIVHMLRIRALNTAKVGSLDLE